MRRANDHGSIRIVPECDVGGGIPEGRFPALRVLREVDAMRLVRHDLVAAEVDGVEDRRAELADATAHVDGFLLAGELAAHDGAVVEEALLQCASADEVVDREGLTRPDDRVVDEVGHEVDVVGPIHSRLVGRELRDLVQLPVRLGHLGGERRRCVEDDRELALTRASRRFLDGGGDCLGIDRRPVLVRYQDDLVVLGQAADVLLRAVGDLVVLVPILEIVDDGRLPVRVLRGEFQIGARRLDQRSEDRVVERELDRGRISLDDVCIEGSGDGRGRDPECEPVLVLRQHDRRIHDAARLVRCRVQILVRQRGCRGRRGERDGLIRCGLEGGEDQVGCLGTIDGLAILRVLQFHVGSDDRDRSLERRVLDRCFLPCDEHLLEHVGVQRRRDRNVDLVAERTDPIRDAVVVLQHRRIHGVGGGERQADIGRIQFERRPVDRNGDGVSHQLRGVLVDGRDGVGPAVSAHIDAGDRHIPRDLVRCRCRVDGVDRQRHQQDHQGHRDEERCTFSGGGHERSVWRLGGAPSIWVGSG